MEPKTSRIAMTTITAPKGAVCTRCRRVFAGNELIFNHPWYGTICTATCAFLTPTEMEARRIALVQQKTSPTPAAKLPPMPRARVITAVKEKRAETSMTDIIRDGIKEACTAPPIVRTPVIRTPVII